MPSKTSASTFAGMVPKKLPEKEIPEPVSSGDSSARSEAPRKRSGKIAKYNNKDFRQTNFYVNVNNFADAYAILQKERAGKDMSDLVNELIAKWLKEQAS